MDEIYKFDTESQLLTKEKNKLKRPSKYIVVLLNDDYTPRDFVVWVLQVVFHHNHWESERIMLEAHTTGKAICGVFSHDVAKTKQAEVHELAAEYEHPLQCVLEVEDGGES